MTLTTNAMLDLRSFSCPKPLIETKIWLKQAKLNDRVIIKLSDPGSIHDVPKYINSQEKFSMSVKKFADHIALDVIKIAKTSNGII